MSETTSNPAGKGHGGPTWFIAALLAIYILFPHAYIIPALALARATRYAEPVTEGIKVFVTPVQFLYDHVPPYKALIDAEGKLVVKVTGGLL